MLLLAFFQHVDAEESQLTRIMHFENSHHMSWPEVFDLGEVQDTYYTYRYKDTSDFSCGFPSLCTESNTSSTNASVDCETTITFNKN